MVISEWICVNCCCFFSSLFHHRTDCLLKSAKCFAGYLPSQLLFYRQDIFEGFIGFHAVAGGRKIFEELYQNVRHARSVKAIVFSSISTFVACSCFRQRYRNSRPLPGRREMFGENSILSKWKPVVQRHRFLLNLSCLENEWINVLKSIWIATSTRKRWSLVLLNEGFSYWRNLLMRSNYPRPKKGYKTDVWSVSPSRQRVSARTFSLAII